MVAKETGYSRRKRAKKPLDQAGLNDLALSYVARFATSGAKLESYLARKIRERGVAEGEHLDPQAVAQRLVELNYIDDEAYAMSKAGSLLRKGYGGRRVEQALRAAGIEESLRGEVAPGEVEKRRSVILLARKRGFGPFGQPFGGDAEGHKRREKQIAAMVRAGHGFDAARKVVEAGCEEELDEWLIDAQEAER